jgi:hypothetical protein
MTAKKREATRGEKFSPSEQRAARSERILVDEAEPYGWMARSESDPASNYHLFRDPDTKQLACTCADFVYRGNAEPGYECKHVSAVLKYIARQYLAHEYVCERKKVA